MVAIDELKQLVSDYKDFNGSAADSHFQFSNDSSIAEAKRLALIRAFNNISENLQVINTFFLTGTRSETVWRQTFLDLKDLNKLCQKEKLFTFDTLLSVVKKLQTSTLALLDECVDPSAIIVHLGDDKKGIKVLAVLPLTIFWRAGLQIDKSADPVTRSYLRRIMLSAINGGIPIHFLDKPELQGFPYNSDYFESCGFPFNNYEFNNHFDAEISEIASQFETFKNHCQSKHFNEASLRMHLWDPILNILFKNRLHPNVEIISELNLQSILPLDDLRKVDYSVLSKKYKYPVLLVEMAEEAMNQPLSHKDFTKLTTILTISCINQAETLRRNKINPVLARTFGIWDGGTQCQLLVAHPVIVKKPNEEFDAIYIVISSPDHWFLDLARPNSFPLNRNSDCYCCNGTIGLYRVPPRTQLPDDLKTISDDRDLHDLNMEDPTPSTSISSSAIQPQLRTFSDCDPESLKRLAIFIYCIKNHIDSIDQIDSNSGPGFKGFKIPNNTYVPGSRSKHEISTPSGKKMKHTEMAELGVSKRLFQAEHIGLSSVEIRKPLTFEFELYRKYLKNLPIFPFLCSAEIDANYVNYKFEYMEPLLGTGVFGVYFDEKSFGPNVRGKQFGPLLVDTLIFSVHVLNALHCLHEEFGVVHCDISPSNVMYSSLDDCWKLIDFGESLILQDSVTRPREIGTSNYIAPESIKTGIFDKASDIFSLASVIKYTLNIRLMYLLEMQGCDRQLEMAYDKFFSVIQQMLARDPAKRPSAKQAMKNFLEILFQNDLQKFGFSGNKRLLLDITSSINIQS